MDREQFGAFLDDCRARGFEYVKTKGGHVALDDWHPYGAFNGGNPGIERHIGGFRWHSHNQAADYSPHDYTGVNGLWTFLTLADVDPESAEAEMLAAEQESNYLRGLGV